MTPAEHIRATMALLETIAEPTDNASVIDQLFNTPIDVPELDEGAGVKSILATLIAAAGMSLASGASAASGVDDARCAGAMTALSMVDQAKGDTKYSNLANDIAKKLSARAAQGGVQGEEFRKQANSGFNTIKQFVENGKENQARNFGMQCIDTLQSGGEKPLSAAAAKERAQDQENSQRQAQQQSFSGGPNQATAQSDAPAVNSYQIKRDAMDAASAMKQGNTNMRDNIANRYRNDPQAWAQFKQEYNSWASAIR